MTFIRPAEPGGGPVTEANSLTPAELREVRQRIIRARQREWQAQGLYPLSPGFLAELDDILGDTVDGLMTWNAW